MNQIAGSTKNFIVQYDTTCINGPNRAQVLLGFVESEFSALTFWFGITDGFGEANKVTITLTPNKTDPTYNNLYMTGGQTEIQIDCADGNTDVQAAEIVKMLFVAKFSKVLMSHPISGWDSLTSNGEGLAHFCAAERYSVGYYLYFAPAINFWLNSSPRVDFVKTKELSDMDKVGYGCALLFLYYMKTQLGKSVMEIIQNGQTTLEKTYESLFGMTGGNVNFINLIKGFFPPDKGIVFSLQTENPFPLLDVTKRGVSISLKPGIPSVPVQISTGTSFVQFPGCNQGKDYKYYLNEINQGVICTAESFGFGQPLYTWRINGILVPGSQDTPILTQLPPMSVSVITLDPANPQNRIYGQTTVSLSCYNDGSAIEISVLKPVTGQLNITVELDATDQYDQPGQFITAKQTATINIESLTWENNYYYDARSCSQKLLNETHSIFYPNNWLKPAIAVHYWLPDPIPFDLLNILKQLEGLMLQDEKQLGKEFPTAISDQVYQLFLRRLNSAPVPAEIAPIRNKEQLPTIA